MSCLREKLSQLKGSTVQNEKITEAIDFSYTDPVTGEITPNQGVCLYLGDEARIIFRLSGTNSVGATLKIYINKRITNNKKYDDEPTEILKNMLQISLEISQLKYLTGVEKPSMIT